MKSAVIGFDTSNYRTSAAVVSLDGEILMNFRELLQVPSGSTGLRQSEAVYAHVRSLRKAERALRDISTEIILAAACASVRPRDPEESFMPTFQVGYTMAVTLASCLGIPFFETTHQRGHLEAALAGSGADRNADLLFVHLSGGTTDMLLASGDRLDMIGGSLDLHAGQLVDRAGAAMGLQFPAGPYLEKLAEKGQSEGRLGCSMADGDLNCHLSGAETQVIRWIKDGTLGNENAAMEIYDFLARTVARMVSAGARVTGSRQALIAGGIASSLLFRKLLVQRTARNCRGLKIFFGDPELSGDNAVGVAMTGINRLLRTAEQEV